MLFRSSRTYRNAENNARLSLSTHVRSDSPPDADGTTPFAPTREWLADIKLEMCHAALLKELDYDEDMQMVIDGDDEEVQDMIGAVEGVEGVKPHLKKFKRELAKFQGKNEQFP